MLKFADPRRILHWAPAYSAWRTLVGRASHGDPKMQFIKARDGDRILDIGCGPADILESMPEVDYVGFDASEKYIDLAQKRYGTRGKFVCQDVGTTTLQGIDPFDIVLAIGVLHHLSDEECIQLFQLARSVLKPSGRLVTVDGCFADDLSWLGRWILAHDRGEFVRNQGQYTELANKVFANVKSQIHYDLNRLPVAHLIMDCQI